MLIRTRQLVRRSMIAVRIRVLLFFAIPTLYFVVTWATVSHAAENIGTTAGNIDSITDL